MTRVLLFCLLVTGCERCTSRGPSADAGDAGSAPFEVGTPAKIAPPALAPIDGYQGYGLPSGCRFEGPVQKATLPEGRTRFVAPRERLGALALAHAAAAISAGFFDAASRTVNEAPWAELDAPPLFEHAESRWLGAWIGATASGTRRALLWRGGKLAEPLAEGDQLELSDFACAGDDCAVLSHLVRGAAAPGASWLAGKAGQPAAEWRRVDLDLGGDEPWLPLAIASIEPGGSGWAALSSGKHVALFRVDGARAEKKHSFDAPHGAYDATVAPEPVAVAPGAAPDRPCGAEPFPVVLMTAQGKRHVLDTAAPPESVIARPLAKGALVGWVARVACQHLDRRVIQLTRLDASGAPASSTMGVADATGFALSTRGSELALWLVNGRELALIRGRCD